MPEGHIRINPYAVSPRKAIRLMSDICLGKPDVNVETDRLSLENLVRHNFDNDWIIKNVSNIGTPLLFNELSKKLERMAFAMSNDFFGNYKRVRVTVSGITSSGKSCLINFLLKRSDLLPVDPNPSTILPTHIYCTNRMALTKAYAVNHRNALIQVDLNAISGIQHANASSEKSMEMGLAEQISSSMSRFLLEFPNKNFNDIEFIDSPGFNANEADDAAAQKCLENSDVVLFLVDINACIGKEDIKILECIKKPLILVANCNNKMNTRREVLANFRNICESVDGFENIIDCVCISSKEPLKYGFFSRSGGESMDVFGCMERTIKLLASKKSAHTEIDGILDDIKQLFQNETNFQRARIKKLEQDRADINSYTVAKLSKEYIRHKSVSKEVLKELEKISNSSTILSEDKFYNRFHFLMDYYLNSEEEKDKRLSRLFELYNQAIQQCTEVIKRLDQLNTDIKEWYSSRKDTLGTDRVTAYVRQQSVVPNSPFSAVDSIYDCELEGLIEMLSTEEGFDVLNTYNETGYSLMTYAAFRGNVHALQLIISSLGKERLIRRTDKEERNILHAAAEGGNISLFNYLKDKFPGLICKKDRMGRTPEDLLHSNFNNIKN